MFKLYNYPLDPFCRRIRISSAEFEIELELIEERPWDARPEFLKMNPTGSVPVLVAEDGSIVLRAVADSGILGDLND